MSHGCVNAPTDQAEWIFGWADIGTPVYIHY
jgi:lipoprotein-anchoring transpeptidase ErfK/SrfK